MIESSWALPAEKEVPLTSALSVPFGHEEKVTLNCLSIFLKVTFTITFSVILTLTVVSPSFPPSVFCPPVIVQVSTT